MLSIQDVAELFFNGVAVGSILALAAVGLTLTYGILRLSNFAHGDFMTLGAYLTWLANDDWGVNIFIAAIFGAGGTVCAMLLAEQLLWKPMRDRRATSTSFIILSIGLALFIRYGIQSIWGSSNKSYNLPQITGIDIFGMEMNFFTLKRWIAILLAFLAVVALRFLLQKTKIGKAMRAVSDSIDLARISGINVEWVVLWTWIITGTMTALAGIMFGTITAIHPNIGWYSILPMFASVILGGIGNPYGAIAGALSIGIAQELSIPLLGADYKLGVALLIMIIILLLRPQGLFKGTV